jgi:hypothetical protein
MASTISPGGNPDADADELDSAAEQNVEHDDTVDA